MQPTVPSAWLLVKTVPNVGGATYCWQAMKNGPYFEYKLGMSVLCEYAIAAFFAYFSKVCISHVFPTNWHF